MKIALNHFLLVILFSAIIVSGCHQNKQKAELPDIESIYLNINYLDSILQAIRIDSISGVNENLTAKIEAYANRARSAEDKAILDSLTRITGVVNDFLQFCTTTQTNLELLEQDTRMLESDYRSGKVKIAAYVSALLEEEQVLIGILEQLSLMNRLALQSLGNQEQLTGRLNPLPVEGL
jgi:hypothetical protein